MRAAFNQAAKPTKPPKSVYAATFTACVLIAEYRAARSLAPTAITYRPKRVLLSRKLAPKATAKKAMRLHVRSNGSPRCVVSPGIGRPPNPKSANTVVVERISPP